MLNENYNIRRIIAFGIAAILIIVAAVWLYKYLSTGQITLKTDNPDNYLKISGLTGTKTGKFSVQAQHKLSARVKPGAYEISVYDKHGINGMSRTIKLKARQHLTYTLEPASVSDPVPVYGKKTNSVYSDGSQLLFVGLESLGSDSHGDGHIIQVDQNNNLTTMFPDTDFSEVRWANANLGVGYDRFDTLYIIHDGALSKPNLPFTTDPDHRLSVDISKQGKIYASYNKNVYTVGLDGKFTKIYTSGTSSLKVAAGTHEVAVVESGQGIPQADEGGSVDGSNKSRGTLTVIDESGKTTKKTVYNVRSAAWSPSGKYLLASGPAGEQVFDSSLHQVDSISLNNAFLYTWFDDSSLMYSIDSQLWSYSLKTQSSHKISALVAGLTITGIYPNADGSYVYITDDNGEKTQLFRVGLKGQPVDKPFSTIDVIMPETVGSCTFNYIYFTKITVLIDYPNGQSPQACIDSAKQELQYYELDVNKVQFQPLSPVGD